MTTSNSHALPSNLSTPTATGRVVRLVIAAVAGLVRSLRHRRDVHSLLELDERALKDMGITRNDVLGALAQPVGVDPSIVLLVRSVEQRSRRRASSFPARMLNAPADVRLDA